MRKTIKISEQTYGLLEDYRDKRETFDDALARLLRSEAQLKSSLRDLAGESDPSKGGGSDSP